MKDQLISFETAKMAKEKGFFTGNICDIYPLIDFYGDYKKGKLSVMIEESGDHAFAAENDFYAEAPTQALLQKWLREKHKLAISITRPSPIEVGLKTSYGYFIDNLKYPLRDIQSSFWFYANEGNFSDCNFNTYEQALEAGLQSALKLIK